MATILVTGAFGQIGTELTQALRERHGAHNVLATSRRIPESCSGQDTTAAGVLDVTDRASVRSLFEAHRFESVYHLAARLSAVGELDPTNTWSVNIDGLRNVLDAARAVGTAKIFWPSSIAVFGPELPKRDVPQDAPLHPATMYGVTKVAGELLCDYYSMHYQMDVRGVRYPGVISASAMPGGGTTDYAVEIFHHAVASGHYTCFVREDCILPMIYMPDAITAALDLMAADPGALERRNGFNLAAMSFSAGELAERIGQRIHGFDWRFEPDARQIIADSWPESIDDRDAREQWGWQPTYNLDAMVDDMLARLREAGNSS